MRDSWIERFGVALRTAAVALALAGVGCAAYRGGQLGAPGEWPPSAPQGVRKLSVCITLRARAEDNGSPAYVPRDVSQSWVDVTRDVYEDSGLFSDFVPPGRPADLRAEVEVLDRTGGNIVLAFVCGLTGTIIPCRLTDEFTWKTTFKDGAGAVRGVVEKRETYIVWYQLFLAFGLLFESPQTTFTELLRDLNRSTLHEALGAGYLKP